MTMGKLIGIITLVLAIGWLTAGPAHASCTTHTYALNGRVVTCQTCCFGTMCNTTCF
jgi:hypothetical protein